MQGHHQAVCVYIRATGTKHSGQLTRDFVIHIIIYSDIFSL